MNKKLLIVLCLAAALLIGCGKDGEESTTPVIGEGIAGTDSQPSEEEPTQSDENLSQDGATTITDRVVVNGQMQSYLTGEWKAEEVVKRRPMAVMIPNNKAALPQYGISLASIIYEAPVEGRTSRLMGIFEDYDELEYVGPIRSSRDYYIYEAMAYDAIYCNWGLAVPYVEELINSDRVDNVSAGVLGIHNPADEAFGRRSRPGYSTEYTAYMYVDGYEKAVDRLGYETKYRDTFEQAFTFAADGHPATYDDHKDATIVRPGGTTTNSSGYGQGKSSFEYNAEDGLYYHYEFGSAHIDEYNKQQVTVSNVVFKICHGEVRDANDYLSFGVHGSGEAYVFTAGKVIHGTWIRANDTAANMFYDENGDEIIFNQGKTWICNIWDEYAEYIEYE